MLDRDLDRERILHRARMHVGHREVAPNRSPLIDAWVRACGVPLGSPWCAAFASWCLGHEPPCAGALRLGRAYAETRNPSPGDLMYFATDAKGSGHIGIVIAGCGLDEVLCVEGNSASQVRYVRRLRSQVLFSSTRPDEPALLPCGLDTPAPLVAVTYEGTR